MEIETSKNYLSDFKQLPLDVKSVFWFSLLLSVAGQLLILPDKELYAVVMPYTGWLPVGIFYVPFGILFLTFSPTSNRTNLSNAHLLRVSSILMLVVPLILAINSWINVIPEDYTLSNPSSLSKEQLRPTYTVFMRLFWLLVIGGPLLKNLLNKKPEASV